MFPSSKLPTPNSKPPINCLVKTPTEILVNFLKEDIFGDYPPFLPWNCCLLVAHTRICDMKTNPFSGQWLKLNEEIAKVEHEFTYKTTPQEIQAKVAQQKRILNRFILQNNLSATVKEELERAEAARSSETSQGVKQAVQRLDSEQENLNKLDNAVTEVYLQKLDIEPAPWNYNKNIKEIFELLSKSGPFIAYGNYGFNFYDKPPVDAGGKIGTFSVLQFPKNSAKEVTIESPSHAVMIVGVRIGVGGSKDLIFYVDPSYELSAEGKNAAPDSIFVMSADLFLTRMRNAENYTFAANGKDNCPFLAAPPFFHIAKDFGLLQRTLLSRNVA